MSDPAAQPWWAEVQHLRPREGDERRDEAREARKSRRFVRDLARVDTPGAVATAVNDDLDQVPLLDEIDWESFVEAHADVDLEHRRGLAAIREANGTATDADRLAALDWDVDLDPRGDDRDPVTGRRTVEIRGHADRATATVDEPLAAPRIGRRRPAQSPADHLVGRPDRVAMWAFILGLILMLVAALGTPEADAAVRLVG